VDDAIRAMRAVAAAEGRHDGPGAAGTTDPDVLRTVLATLPHDDQRLLWDRHVRGRDVAAIGTELGMHARAVLRRLRRAEERLAGAFAAAHARACPPGCFDTRQSLHAYVRHRLTPRRRTVLEAHLFGCQGCMRAFVDVREAGWAVRDAGPLLLAGAGGAAPVVVGALGAGATGVLGWTGPVGAALLAAWDGARAFVLRLAQLGKGGLIGAGTVAGVAVAAVAVAMSGGGGSGPAAAPSSPRPSTSQVAPAPAPSAAASPEAPPGPGPSETIAPSPTPTTDPADPPASTSAPSDPGTAPGTTSPQPDDPSTAPSASPDPTATPEPTRSSTSPTPSPSPSPSASPSPSPTPTGSPSPTPTPTPTATPDPEPEVTTHTARTSGLRGIYAVTVSDPDATVVGVEGDDRWLRAKECSAGWRVGSWRNRVGTVTVTVEAPPGVEPDVGLDRVSNWPGWLHTC